MTYALDANIIIDFLSRRPFVVKQFDKTVFSGIKMVIPSVVDYEVLRGFYHTPMPRKEVVYSKLRLACPIMEVNADIWDCAASLWANLRKAGRTIDDADIIIAAHCITSGYTLVTHNVKHFEHINELQLTDWA